MNSKLYRILMPILVFLFKLFYRPKYIGVDNIPKDGRVVLVGNHTNILDCILVAGSTKRVVHYLAKDELTKGFKKIIFNNMGIIPVNRRIHDKGALKSAIDILNNDEVIGIFPEGTINRTDDIIMPFKIGAVKMGYETNSLLVPFTITGKYKIFGGIEIEFYKSYKIDSADLDKENNKLVDIISSKLERKGFKK